MAASTRNPTRARLHHDRRFENLFNRGSAEPGPILIVGAQQLKERTVDAVTDEGHHAARCHRIQDAANAHQFVAIERHQREQESGYRQRADREPDQQVHNSFSDTMTSLPRSPRVPLATA
jgi:hypothetical protein